MMLVQSAAGCVRTISQNVQTGRQKRVVWLGPLRLGISCRPQTLRCGSLRQQLAQCIKLRGAIVMPPDQQGFDAVEPL